MQNSEATLRFPKFNGLGQGTGIGYKYEHGTELLEMKPELAFLEVHAENYMAAGGPSLNLLEKLRGLYPLSVHGVGLSIGGEGPLDQTHLVRLQEVCTRFEPQSFSEHLAWSSHEAFHLPDLLPIAYTHESMTRVCNHIDEVQNFLKRKMLLENPSTYVAFAASTWDEADFMTEVIRRTGCGMLLDVNNIVVTCTNHGFEQQAYLARLPLQAVGELHLAGYAEEQDSLGDRLLIDAHGSPVEQDVWQLYADVLSRIGPKPTLIEWDNDVPPLQRLLQEVGKANGYLTQAQINKAA